MDAKNIPHPFSSWRLLQFVDAVLKNARDPDENFAEPCQLFVERIAIRDLEVVATRPSDLTGLGALPGLPLSPTSSAPVHRPFHASNLAVRSFF